MRILMLESEYGRYRELSYASCVAKKYAETLRRKGHQVVELERPAPDEANAKIRSFKPDIIWFVGHGYENRATLERMRLWVTTMDDLWQFKGRVVVAHSCLTAVRLGKDAVRKGALAYFGFLDEMWFLWCDETKYDNCACKGINEYGARKEVWMKLVTYPHVPPLEFLVHVAEGAGFKEAFDMSLRKVDELIKDLESIQPANPGEASMIKVATWVLETNKSNQIVYSRTPTGKLESTSSFSIFRYLGMATLIAVPVFGLVLVGGGETASKEIHYI